MTYALSPLERYTLYSKVSIHEAPTALHDMTFFDLRTCFVTCDLSLRESERISTLQCVILISL